MMNYISFNLLFNDATDYSSAEAFKFALLGTVDPTTTMFKKHQEQVPQTIDELLGDSYDEVLTNIHLCATSETDEEFTKAIERISGLHHCDLLQTPAQKYDILVSDRKVRTFMAFVAITNSLFYKEH